MGSVTRHGQERYMIKQRLPLSILQSVSLSPLADNFVTFHVDADKAKRTQEIKCVPPEEWKTNQESKSMMSFQPNQSFTNQTFVAIFSLHSMQCQVYARAKTASLSQMRSSVLLSMLQ